MTAGEIVSNACKQSGLVEDGTTTSIVSTLGIGSLSIGGGITAEAGNIPTTAADIGLAILNRWYLYAWQRYPHRDIRIANDVIEVPAGALSVDLSQKMDAIRSVRIAGGALLPLASPTAEAWKCYASFPIEGGRFIKHAPGLHAPGWNGENLPGLNYLPQQPAP